MAVSNATLQAENRPRRTATVRGDARRLAAGQTDEIVVLSESNRQDWPPISTRPELDIPITGSMGKASSFGLGLALARPEP